MSIQISEQPVIGVLGGTFDPIHHGHLRLAAEAKSRFNLQKILFVPAPIPRLRDTPDTSVKNRLKMLQQAIQDVAWMEVSDIELTLAGESRTVRTMSALRERYLGAKLLFIVGSDVLINLDKWWQWQSLLEQNHIAIANRDKEWLQNSAIPATVLTVLKSRLAESFEEIYQSDGGKIFILSCPMLEISATYIRNCVNNNRSIRYLIPEAVCSMIEKESLYVRK